MTRPADSWQRRHREVQRAREVIVTIGHGAPVTARLTKTEALRIVAAHSRVTVRPRRDGTVELRAP